MGKSLIGDMMFHLDGQIHDEDLATVKKVLSIVLTDYDISEKCTDIQVYNSFIPECYQKYLVTRKIEGLSRNSLQLYKLYLDDFFAHLRKPFKEIISDDVLTYLYWTQEQRKISNRTLDSRRSVLSAFFSWASSEGYIDKNPCASIRPIKYTRKPKESLPPMKLEEIRTSNLSVRERAIIEFLYSTGCRVSELTHVNLNDINFRNHEVVLLGKGNKYRNAYVNTRCELALKNYLNSRDDSCEALFISERKPYDRLKVCSIRQILHKIEKRLNLKINLHPHKFRTTMATDSLAKGLDITEIQQILGHSNINTTMIYANINTQNTKYDYLKYMN